MTNGQCFCRHGYIGMAFMMNFISFNVCYQCHNVITDRLLLLNVLKCAQSTPDKGPVLELQGI